MAPSSPLPPYDVYTCSPKARPSGRVPFSLSNLANSSASRCKQSRSPLGQLGRIEAAQPWQMSICAPPCYRWLGDTPIGPHYQPSPIAASIFLYAFSLSHSKRSGWLLCLPYSTSPSLHGTFKQTIQVANLTRRFSALHLMGHALHHAASLLPFDSEICHKLTDHEGKTF